MTTSLNIRVRGGSTLVVPSSAQCLSTYVLLEQEDWFEKEIGFIRRVLRPGMRAIDVGANFGCYSVAIAQAIGPTGSLWLYEPTSSTFEYLSRSLELNGLSFARPIKVALSDHEGRGALAIGENSELNSLARANPGANIESVRLMTLDAARVAHSIDSVDFVKLDAEGEEVRIVRGAQEFFSSENPLVMFEVKHGDSVNADLPLAFERMGYQLYRLVGPDTMLVPIKANAQLDGFELNLFACKAERGALLEDSGHLISASDRIRINVVHNGLDFWRLQSFSAAFPGHAEPHDPVYRDALNHYAAWRDTTRPSSHRYAALEAALRDLISLVDRAMTLPRLFTLVRVARESGARTLAVQGLFNINKILGKGGYELDEPCWPALERYDTLEISRGVESWLVASAAEALATSTHFSGYFSGPSALAMLDWLHDSNYASAPMERRRELQAIFAGRQSVVQGSALLQQSGTDNLNPNLWHSGTDVLHRIP